MSFGQLFRASKFVSTQRNQILTAPQSAREQGDWGLKATLPKIKTPFITCSAQDDENATIRYSSAFDTVSQQQRFKENFSTISVLPIEPLKKPRDLLRLSTLPAEDWVQLVEKAKGLRTKWKVLVEEGRYQPHDVYGFLGVNTKTQVPITHPSYQIATYKPAEKKSLFSSAYMPKPKGAGSAEKHTRFLPTFDPNTPVKGRFLNQIKGRFNIYQVDKGGNGFAIGIAGFVALLEQANVDSKQMLEIASDRRKVTDFWVRSMSYGDKGELTINVSMTPPEKKKNLAGPLAVLF